MSAIAKSYWRSIRRRDRAFKDVPDSVKDDVRALAADAIKSGAITAEDYQTYIGETYFSEEG